MSSAHQDAIALLLAEARLCRKQAREMETLAANTPEEKESNARRGVESVARADRLEASAHALVHVGLGEKGKKGA